MFEAVVKCIQEAQSTVNFYVVLFFWVLKIDCKTGKNDIITHLCAQLAN